MSQPTAALIPQVFVLWHPACVSGERMAERILRWLRPGSGLGPEVFYRCLPAPEAPAGGLPPPLPRETRSMPDQAPSGQRKVSNLEVVIPLIDENMAADRTWRYWLEHLAKVSATARKVMPVALDPTAYNMPAAVRELNYLRPTGMPLSGGDLDSPAFDAVIRSLLKQVTESMCRLILPRPPSQTESAADAPLPKINVFLSHAKQDGMIPARRLRDYIYGQTQLAAFYDENDIAYGDMFERVITNALGSTSTAAFVAVRSAMYSSRPWCRRELSLFRRPRPGPAVPGKPEQWRVYPTLVVEAMEGRHLAGGIPELGNSPVIRWTGHDGDMEELIITTVIRDAMLAAFHSTLAASIPSTHPDQIAINWLPDPTTLLHIPRVREAGEREVLYPGRGLSGMELQTLEELFPNLTFRSFEEALLRASRAGTVRVHWRRTSSRSPSRTRKRIFSLVEWASTTSRSCYCASGDRVSGRALASPTEATGSSATTISPSSCSVS